MRALTVSGRVAISLLIMSVCIFSALANEDYATVPDVTVMGPMISESMLVASSGLEAHTSTASLVTVSSVDIADYTSVSAAGNSPDPVPTLTSSDITMAPSETIHPDVVHPFEIEPHHTRPYFVGGLPIVNAARDVGDDDSTDSQVITTFVTTWSTRMTIAQGTEISTDAHHAAHTTTDVYTGPVIAMSAVTKTYDHEHPITTVTVTHIDPCRPSAAHSAGQDDHAIPAVDTTFNPSDVVGPASTFSNSSASAATRVGGKADLIASTAAGPDACAVLGFTTYTSTSTLTSTSTFTSVTSTATDTAATSTTQDVGADDRHDSASTTTENKPKPTTESHGNWTSSAGSRRYEVGSQSSCYQALLAVIVCFVAGVH